MKTDLEISINEQRVKNLKFLIEKDYKNIHDFCQKNDLDYALVHRYVNGKMRIGKIAMKRFEKVFGLLPNGLDKDNVLMTSGMCNFPVYPCNGIYSTIQDILSQQIVSTAYLTSSEIKILNVDKEKQIAIKYCNDSMSPLIKNGWHVLINMEDQTIEDGEDYALLYNGKFLIRKIFFNSEINNLLTLKAENPRFDNFSVEDSKIIIIGKPVYILFGKL